MAGAYNLVQRVLTQRSRDIFSELKTRNTLLHSGPSISKIDDHIYLGGVDTEDYHPVVLFKSTIGHWPHAVISILDESSLARIDTDCDFGVDVQYHQFTAFDNVKQSMTRIWLDVDALLTQYRREDKTVFIHCYAGRSRSASSVIFHYHHSLGYELIDAYKHIKGKRPLVYLNDYFLAQLVAHRRCD